MTDAQRIALLEHQVMALHAVASRQNDMLLRLTMGLIALHPEIAPPSLTLAQPVLQ